MRKSLVISCLLWAFAAQGLAQTQTTSRQDIPRLVASARGTVVLLKTFDPTQSLMIIADVDVAITQDRVETLPGGRTENARWNRQWHWLYSNFEVVRG
jgi:hypothetical protein